MLVLQTVQKSGVASSPPAQKIQMRQFDKEAQKEIAGLVNQAVQELLRSGALEFTNKPPNNYHPVLDGYVYQKPDGSFYAVMVRYDLDGWNRLAVERGKPAVVGRDDEQKEETNSLVGSVRVSKDGSKLAPVGDYEWSAMQRFAIKGNSFAGKPDETLFVRVGKWIEPDK